MRLSSSLTSDNVLQSVFWDEQHATQHKIVVPILLFQNLGSCIPIVTRCTFILQKQDKAQMNVYLRTGQN